MDFSLFAHTMKDALCLTDHKGKKLTAGDFTRELLSLCVDYDNVDENPIYKLEAPTFACYFNGSRTISKLASEIIDHIDTTEFYNKLNELVFDQIALIVDGLKHEYPNIDDNNYIDICDNAIKDIIRSSLKKKSNDKQSSSTAIMRPDISTLDTQIAREALQRLKLLYYEKETLFIHYACTNFDDPVSIPRITCIAVSSLLDSVTVSFSVYQSAIELKIAAEQMQQNLDILEYDLLSKFFQYLSKHKKSKWVHWNMRDIQFGFYTIEARYQALGGTPKSISSTNTVDLAHELKLIYGHDYVPHKRLTNICRLNDITMQNFINGEDEANAAQAGNYRMISNSTLRKVSCIRSVFEKTVHGTLKTAKDLKL